MITNKALFGNTQSQTDTTDQQIEAQPGSFDPRLGLGLPSFTSIPDVFFDQIAPNLSGAEIKVLLYILRRTYGFKKQQDAISYSQFLDGITCRDGRQLDQGAGIKSDRTLTAALDSLCDKGLIFRHQQRRADGMKAVTIYELNLDGQSHYRPGQPTGEPQGEPAPTAVRSSQVERSPRPGQELTAKIADNPTAKIADNPTAKIADTKHSINNKQFKQHTEGAAAPEPLVCVAATIGQEQQQEEGEAKSHIPISLLTDENPEKAVQEPTNWGYIALIKAGVKPAKARTLADTEQAYLERLIEASSQKDNPAGYIVTMISLGAEPGQPKNKNKTTTSDRQTPLQARSTGQKGLDLDKYTTGKYAFLTRSSDE